MNMLNAVIQVPAWAYDFCYYYFAVAAIIAIFGVYSIVTLFTLPSSTKKLLPLAMMVLSMSLPIVLSVVLGLMQFWICRSALRPSAAKEAFAVKCAKDADCTAVMGTPQGPAASALGMQGSLCSCGGRGTCGGCVMQNNMEPQASFSAEFAPIENFAVRPAARHPVRPIMKA
jgi:hypothetical protein